MLDPGGVAKIEKVEGRPLYIPPYDIACFYFLAKLTVFMHKIVFIIQQGFQTFPRESQNDLFFCIESLQSRQLETLQKSQDENVSIHHSCRRKYWCNITVFMIFDVVIHGKIKFCMNSFKFFLS